MSFNLITLNKPMNLNDDIQKFALAMQVELDANTHKGNYKEYRPTLEETEKELNYHFQKFINADTDEEKREYLADCANILMFQFNQLI